MDSITHLPKKFWINLNRGIPTKHCKICYVTDVIGSMIEVYVPENEEFKIVYPHEIEPVK